MTRRLVDVATLVEPPPVVYPLPDGESHNDVRRARPAFRNQAEVGLVFTAAECVNGCQLYPVEHRVGFIWVELSTVEEICIMKENADVGKVAVIVELLF